LITPITSQYGFENLWVEAVIGRRIA